MSAAAGTRPTATPAPSPMAPGPVMASTTLPVGAVGTVTVGSESSGSLKLGAGGATGFGAATGEAALISGFFTAGAEGGGA